MPKNDEGSIRCLCKYLVPKARIKQHRAVKLDVLKTSKDESERWSWFLTLGATHPDHISVKLRENAMQRPCKVLQVINRFVWFSPQEMRGKKIRRFCFDHFLGCCTLQMWHCSTFQRFQDSFIQIPISWWAPICKMVYKSHWLIINYNRYINIYHDISYLHPSS